MTDIGWTWSHDEPDLAVMALWLERKPGEGEDAQPSFVFDPSRGTGMLATYDGTGGSGSAAVRTTSSGREISGAKVAARLARHATESWFAESLEAHQPDLAPEAQLHDALLHRMDIESQRGLQSSDRFTGSLKRELPTTLAATAFHTDGTMLSIASLWAGDSRCHVLTPGSGLQQLTVDDSPVTDALEAIITDAPMTNLVCADREFTINRLNTVVAQPAVLVSSTDGCFGYVATPAHFEYLILQGLQAANSIDDWGQAILAQLDRFTGDDASLVVVAIGWPSFNHLRQSFEARTQHLHAEHWAPFAGITGADRDRLNTARADSWSTYRPLYEQHLPRLVPPEHSPAQGGSAQP